MPGYVIHLAVAKKFLEKNKEYDEGKFIEGTIAPDLLKEKIGREKTHYGIDGKGTSPEKFLIDHKLDNGYNSGYMLHLITDKMFYNKYFTKWSSKMYDDYDILNDILIKEYDVKLPIEIENKVFSKDGELTFLKLDKIEKFIEDMSEIKLGV